ncbi:MAG TPA: efflux RND transporter periplasmic adaptor subunit [Pyrinomonadaceae bacterium]|jgi:multidrug efflux pump subunit AcrA (membrane-fusion protein)|nr:efflux RND transporter periplasmic adaptor subunit [Pyrinomonadaceae bacterium]
MSSSSLSRRFQIVAPLCLLLAVALFGAACGRTESKANAKENAGETSKSESGGASAEAPPVPVTTTKVLTREVPSYIETTGSLVAEETSDVAPQTSGQVVATPVGVGAFVRQGETIARLNDKDARLRLLQAQAGVQQAIAGVRQAEARLGLRPGGNFDASSIPEVRAANSNLEQAQAQLRLAEANEKRYRELVETGDVALSVYDQYRTQRDTARAQVNAARQQLESAINTARQSNQAIQTAEAAVASARAQAAIAQKAVADATVRAPYAGYVSNRPIAVGEYVTPSSVVATVLRTNPLKLQLQVQEAEAPFITQGMGVSLEVDAYKDRKFSGQVTAVNPAIDPASRAVTIEAAVENGDNALRSGMFATARIARKGGNQAIFVPRAALVSDQNTQSYRVFVIQGNTAKLRVVQLGTEEGDTVQILSGVNADEILATSNLGQLYEGARVKPQ